MSLSVAMYWHNGRSLGHTAESAKIAHALVRAMPGVHIGALTGAYRGLELLPAAVDVIKLPSFANYDRATNAGLHSRIGLDPAALFRLRAELAEVFLRGYRPDVLLVNHMPRGDNDELEAALRGRYAAHNVLTLRGVLFDREKTNRKYFLEPYASWIAEYFDAVTVHMPAELFRLDDHYDVPEYLLDRLHYVGYLPEPVTLTRQECRELLGWSRDERWAVVSMGGGQGAAEIWRAVVPALLHCRKEIDRALLVTGPYLEPEARAAIADTIAEHPCISMVEWHPHLPVLMRAATAFIGAAGSNTIAEVLAAGANAVLIPRQIREPEQRIHSRLVAGRGLARLCDLPDVLSGGLGPVLAEALAAPTLPPAQRFLGGAARYPQLLTALAARHPLHARG